MNIKIHQLKIFSFLYIITPIIIFLLGWIKPIFSIPLVLICSITTFFYIKDTNKEKGQITLSKKSIFLIILIALLWCLFAGIGKLFYQPSFWLDHFARNSIYKDMVTKPWPVKYDKGIYLTYYIGQWIVPSIISKGLALFITNQKIFEIIKNIILYLWCVIGIILIFLWIIKILKIRKRKTIVLIILMFILFSGLDIIGFLIIQKNITLEQFLSGLEFWSNEPWQYSNINSLLFWVFNQMIVPVLITLICIENNDYKYRGVFLISSLLFGPFPTLGLGLYLITLDIKNDIDNHTKNIKKYFSVPNLVFALSILPILVLFYQANINVTLGTTTLYTNFKWWHYILFILLEFLIYIFLIYNPNKTKMKKNSLKIITLYLLIIPFYNQLDFVMRTSIPFLIILWIHITQFIIDKKENSLKKKILITLLSIAAINPLGEICRNIYKTYQQKHFGSDLEEINIYTYDNWLKNNYLSTNNNFFYQHIAKK